MSKWYNWGPLIVALNQDRFTPSSIEEATDVEQNCLVVATQVHDSLLEESAVDLVPYLDSYSGPELVYELCFLIAQQCRRRTAGTPSTARPRRLPRILAVPRGINKVPRGLPHILAVPRRHQQVATPTRPSSYLLF
jgi:hypothetical protein